MEALRIALCEDSEEERANLLSILAESDIPNTVIVFQKGEDFIAQFQAFQHDLILMDIFMEGLTGIDVITRVRETDGDVPVAFITSSMDFTLESYRLEALKYIEKPASKKQIEDLLLMAQMKRKEEQKTETLSVRTQQGLGTYPLSSILYLEQQGRYVLVHLLGGECVRGIQKLGDLEAQLVNKDFLRCHKSYLVNLAHIRGIDRELCTFEMIEGNMVYIRKRSFWEIQKAFETYLFSSSQEIGNEN